MKKDVEEYKNSKYNANQECIKAQKDLQILKLETEYWLQLYSLTRSPFANFCGPSDKNWRLDPRLWGLTLVLDTSVIHDINLQDALGTKEFIRSINQWASQSKMEVCIFIPHPVLLELDHQKDNKDTDTEMNKKSQRVKRHNSEWNECLAYARNIKVKLITQSTTDPGAFLQKGTRVFMDESNLSRRNNWNNDQEIMRIVTYINENSETPLVFLSSDSGCPSFYGDRLDDGVNFIMVDKINPLNSIISNLNQFVNVSDVLGWKYLAKTMPIINSAIQKMREINYLKIE